MLFDSLILAAVTDELARTVQGGKIEKITQPDPFEILLRIYTGEVKVSLLVSCDPEAARAHLTGVARENPIEPPSFCMLLRKYLTAARIEEIEMPQGFGERVLRLTCRAYDGAHYLLIAEIMGKHSNIILVNRPGMILGAAKHISHDINRFREILPGRPYVQPPKQRAKRDPMVVYTVEDSDPMTPADARAWLLAKFSGVSPLLAEETILRAKTPLTPQSLWNALSDLLTVVRVRDYAPVVWTDDKGVLLGAYPVPLLSVPAANQHRRDSISLALDQLSLSQVRRDMLAHGREALLAAMRRTRRQREQEADDARRGLENAARADQYKESGDLIQASASSIERGAESVTVTDYFAPADSSGKQPTRVITLDPKLGARENAERYYKRARKARDSAELLQERLARAEEEVALLTLAESDSSAATSMEQLASIRERVTTILARGTREGVSRAERAREPSPFDGHKIRTFRTVDGWEILVGENATANDYLTTKIAAASDIWLHVRAATSAHGIIRAQNRPASVSSAALQQAAELVAARSEVKHSSLIPVDYTLKKYVRKPRKSAPGAVTYQNEKTLYVAGING